jgi:hypothetical protein
MERRRHWALLFVGVGRVNATTAPGGKGKEKGGGVMEVWRVEPANRPEADQKIRATGVGSRGRGRC